MKAVRTTALKNVLAISSVGLVVACNAILDIPEGHLGDNGTSGTPGDDDDTQPTRCPSGQKRCNQRCVANDKPETGCGNDSCNPCSTNNGTAACLNGKCIVATCNDGFLDCNDDPSDLCEHDITNDRESCGFCNQKCPGTMRCEDATCKCDGNQGQECGGPGWTCMTPAGRCKCGGTLCNFGEGCNDNNDCVGPQ